MNHIIDEIRRYEVDDKKERISSIVSKSQIVQNSLHHYRKVKKETYRKHSPYKLAIDLSKVVEEYTEYIEYIKNNVKDVNEIIQQTDKINKEIAKMNVLLLDVETKMTQLPENIQFRERERFAKLQLVTSNLIETFRSNTNVILEKEEERIKKIHFAINEFYVKISSESFIFNYIK